MKLRMLPFQLHEFNQQPVKLNIRHQWRRLRVIRPVRAVQEIAQFKDAGLYR